MGGLQELKVHQYRLEAEWAELIKSMMPMAERVEVCPCGQEANMMAIRLGRTFTGRRKVPI
jgi:glutamate-1-semialdehyde 2,1-aminomutase